MDEFFEGIINSPESIQILTAVCSLVIATMAVFIAIWNALITRKNALSSVEPAFSAWAEYPSEHFPKYKVVITNKGFGPAIIKSFDVLVDGKVIEGFAFDKTKIAIKRAFGESLVGINYVSSFDVGHALGAGERIELARFEVSPAFAKLGIDSKMHPMRRLSLELRYRDIYKRSWVFSVRNTVGLTKRESKIANFISRKSFSCRNF